MCKFYTNCITYKRWSECLFLGRQWREPLNKCKKKNISINFCRKSLLIADYFIYLCVQIEYICKMGDLNRIKVVLVEKKRTAKWLAEELGKNPATVSKWCTNVSQPDLYTLDKIATLLDIDKRELITGND